MALVIPDRDIPGGSGKQKKIQPKSCLGILRI